MKFDLAKICLDNLKHRDVVVTWQDVLSKDGNIVERIPIGVADDNILCVAYGSEANFKRHNHYEVEICHPVVAPLETPDGKSCRGCKNGIASGPGKLACVKCTRFYEDKYESQD